MDIHCNINVHKNFDTNIYSNRHNIVQYSDKNADMDTYI